MCGLCKFPQLIMAKIGIYVFISKNSLCHPLSTYLLTSASLPWHCPTLGHQTFTKPRVSPPQAPPSLGCELRRSPSQGHKPSCVVLRSLCRFNAIENQKLVLLQGALATVTCQIGVAEEGGAEQKDRSRLSRVCILKAL